MAKKSRPRATAARVARVAKAKPRAIAAIPSTPVASLQATLRVVDSPQIHLSSSVPEDVQRAFELTGLRGPYCRFVRRTETSKPSSRKVVEKWEALDDHALVWDMIVFAPGALSATLPFFGLPPRYGTESGPAEQWLALSEVVAGSVELCQREPQFDGIGILRGRALSPNDLVLAYAADGREYVAQALYKDFVPQAASEKYANFPTLSVAGTAVLCWAELHIRLRGMLSKLTIIERLAMPHSLRLLHSRRPCLKWSNAEFDLLDSVSKELLGAAPAWRANPADPTPTPPPLTLPPHDHNTFPLTDQHLALLRFMREQRGRVLLNCTIADIGPIRDRNLVGKLCQELGNVGLLERSGARSRGWTWSPRADARLIAQGRASA